MWLCKNCGNKGAFKAEGTRTQWVKEYQDVVFWFDENGDVTDSEVEGTNDSYYEDVDNEEWADIRCRWCGELAEEVTEEEWDKWIEGKGEAEQISKLDKLKELKKKMIGGIK